MIANCSGQFNEVNFSRLVLLGCFTRLENLKSTRVVKKFMTKESSYKEQVKDLVGGFLEFENGYVSVFKS